MSRNTHSAVIMIREDTVRNILYEQQRALRASVGWVGPLGVFLALLLTVITMTPKPWLFLDAGQVAGGLGVLVVGALWWLIREIMSSRELRSRGCGIDVIIREMRAEDERVDAE